MTGNASPPVVLLTPQGHAALNVAPQSLELEHANDRARRPQNNLTGKRIAAFVVGGLMFTGGIVTSAFDNQVENAIRGLFPKQQGFNDACSADLEMQQAAKQQKNDLNAVRLHIRKLIDGLTLTRVCRSGGGERRLLDPTNCNLAPRAMTPEEKQEVANLKAEIADIEKQMTALKPLLQNPKTCKNYNRLQKRLENLKQRELIFEALSMGLFFAGGAAIGLAVGLAVGAGSDPF